MDTDQDEKAARLRADLLTALVLVALGLAITYLSWTMPRLEERRIHPATIPGLVPLVLGIALTVCAGLLAARSLRTAAPGGWLRLGAILTGPEARRALAALALVLVYALGLVGWLPFWLASMILIFSFIMLFEVLLASEPVVLVRSALWAAVIAIVAGGGVAYVFQYIFLVRLP